MIPFSNGKIQGYYEMLSNGTFHIHFMGTSDLSEALKDLDIIKVNYKKWKGIHSGFLETTFIAADYIRSLYTSVPLWITGHSLGAAIATLLGVIFYPDAQIDVCGSPRIGGFRFWLKARKHHINRIEIIGDPVTHLPLSIMGFKHIGQAKRYPYKGKNTVESLIIRHYPSSYQPYVSYILNLT